VFTNEKEGSERNTDLVEHRIFIIFNNNHNMKSQRNFTKEN